MLKLLSETGIIKMPVSHIQNLSMNHFHSSSGDSLALVYLIHAGSPLIFVTSPLLINPECLVGKTIVSPELLRETFLNDVTFLPLRSELVKSHKTVMSSDLITLLCYFYLNPYPCSLSMIAKWVSETGQNHERSNSLAQSVYIARTNRDENDPWFLNTNADNNSLFHHNTNRNEPCIHYPDSLQDVFELINVNQELHLTFDSLGQYQSTKHKQENSVNPERINEYGFLIEDHAFIIIGLTVSITELAKIAEVKWPLAFSLLLETVPLYLRDFYSTGRLLAEKPEILDFLVTEYFCKIDLISIAKNGTNFITALDSLGPEWFIIDYNSGIPFYLRICK